ncbi:MAG: DMT family transporter [Myxococcales bacterium]|nr:DMT family transporter [Myxococcales bacterium]
MALAAALLFGATTPVVKQLGAGVGAFATAALLYAGAALGSGVLLGRGGEPALGRAQLGRIALVAIIGAALAPAGLAWGLQHAGALAGSLVLNLEAVFTVFLARALYREPIGRRVWLAVALMLSAGGLLAARAGAGGTSSALGLLVITGATLGWALDNTLTRPLADFDPRAVVLCKALGGALLSVVAALVLRDAWPSPVAAAALLACGATGYGLSLRLYLRAQRTLGAARTGSLFAFAPFAGAVLAFWLGEREAGILVAVAGVLFGAAAYLHATESHDHRHAHGALEHEHAHGHDDGHHLHVHDPAVSGEHTHAHRHEPTEHEHPHGAELHHRHGHD